MFDRKAWKRDFYKKNKKRLSKSSLERYHRRKKADPKGVSRQQKEYRAYQLKLDPEYDRRRGLYSAYKISLEDWNKMFRKQGKRCAICRGKEPNSRHNQWHTDHCHKTGKVRGILCHLCNVGIGSLKDSEKLLLKAVKYLQESK